MSSLKITGSKDDEGRAFCVHCRPNWNSFDDATPIYAGDEVSDELAYCAGCENMLDVTIAGYDEGAEQQAIDDEINLQFSLVRRTLGYC